jgi:hypothetical protein
MKNSGQEESQDIKRNRDESSKKIGQMILPILFAMLCASSLIGFKGKLAEFDTNFSLRKLTYTAAMNFRFYILKDNFFNDVYTKDQHWLSYINDASLDDYQNVTPLTAEELQRIQNNLDNFQMELAKMGIKFYIIMPPNKNTIYPEYLMPEIPIIGEKSRLSQLIKYQRENGSVKIIDIRGKLNNLKREELIYYETDTHWNPRGAYEGYRALIDVIQKDFPRVKPVALEDCEITEAQQLQGDLSKMSGLLGAYSTYNAILPSSNKKSTIKKEKIDDVQFTYFTIDSPELPKAMIYRDSFFTAMQPYLAQNFRELVDIYTYKVDPDLIKEEKPDIVIFLMTERIIQRLIWFPN